MRALRTWLAEHWIVLTIAVMFATVAAAFIGPLVGLLVYAICASVDLAFSTAITIGVALTFVTASYGCGLVLDWARSWIRSLRPNTERRQS